MHREFLKNVYKCVAIHIASKARGVGRVVIHDTTHANTVGGGMRLKTLVVNHY